MAVRAGLKAASLEAVWLFASTESFRSSRSSSLKIQLEIRSHLSLTNADLVVYLSFVPFTRMGVQRMNVRAGSKFGKITPDVLNQAVVAKTRKSLPDWWFSANRFSLKLSMPAETL